MDGLWQEAVDGGGESEVVHGSLSLGLAFYVQLDIRVVDAQLAANAAHVVGSAQVDVAKLIVVVVELVDETLGMKRQSTIGRQLASQVDGGGEQSEAVVVKEVAQVDVYGVGFGVVVALLVDH